MGLILMGICFSRFVAKRCPANFHPFAAHIPGLCPKRRILHVLFPDRDQGVSKVTIVSCTLSIDFAL
jgi:hypothetical protein